MYLFSTLGAVELLDYMPDPILIADLQGSIRFCNQAFTELLKYDLNELLGSSVLDLLLNKSIFDNCLLEVQNKLKYQDQITIFIAKDSELIYTTKHVRMINIQGQECLIVNIRNLSKIDQLNFELHTSKNALEQRSKELISMIDDHKKEIVKKQLELDEIVNIIDEIIWYLDHETMYVKYVSQGIEAIFGHKKELFIENPLLWMSMVHPEDKEKVVNFFTHLKPAQTDAIEFRIIRTDNSVRWLSNRVTLHKSLNVYIGVTHDISQNKKYQENIEFMAYHDSLTKLPNRIYLKEKINEHLEKAKQAQNKFAILFLDLDNFKYINDSMGHDIGDEILLHVSNQLMQSVGDSGICTRFGGDEFVIVLFLEEDEQIALKAEAIINVLNTPVVIAEHEFFISSSIGISLYPNDAMTATELIKSADTAMYDAKLNGKNRYAFFQSVMNANVAEFFHIESIIKEALNNDYFELYFQPLIDTNDFTLGGFEALLRLIHPVYGFISPEKFIPVAETSGDILKISAFVMQNASKFSSQINALSEHDISISINISSRQLKEKDFAQLFLQCVEDYHANPKLLKIEVTESVVMDNINIAIQELNILKDAGIKIALDDFGTGYSSFEYLAQLPINTIKIDKSFIIPIFKKENNKHIVKAITSLAHALNIDVTAEGVETQEHVSYLKAHQVDTLQGYFYSKAIPSREILENFSEYKTLFNL